ncbi:MAG: hypothetical protein Q8R25_04525 [bacterium]|nr:hypothetical protein [bacterium]
MAWDTFSYDLFGWQKIPHYWGDSVRVLFVTAAALAIVAIPLFGDLLPYGSRIEIISAVVLVILAALTNPHSQSIMIINAVVAAVGVVLYEQAAVSLYSGDGPLLFVARGTVALLLLFALYFSVKTIRSMMLHKIGHAETFGEFVDERDPEVESDT